MPEVPGVRRALGLLPPGASGIRLELRSGEALEGELLGFDGEIAVMRTPEGEDQIEAEEVIAVKIDVESQGPE